jgi:hypothetical protein
MAVITHTLGDKVYFRLTEMGKELFKVVGIKVEAANDETGEVSMEKAFPVYKGEWREAILESVLGLIHVMFMIGEGIHPKRMKNIVTDIMRDFTFEAPEEEEANDE